MTRERIFAKPSSLPEKAERMTLKASQQETGGLINITDGYKNIAALQCLRQWMVVELTVNDVDNRNAP